MSQIVYTSVSDRIHPGNTSRHGEDAQPSLLRPCAPINSEFSCRKHIRIEIVRLRVLGMTHVPSIRVVYDQGRCELFLRT